MPTTLITGASRGIGLELARQARARGDEVIASCRRASPELEALDVTVVSDIDVSQADSVARLAEAVGQRPIDLLINNAGILGVESLDDFDEDRIRQQFEINAVGPLRVTRALLGQLQRGSKVALITSRMGSIADNGSGGAYGYRMSKAALNIAGVSLARDLQDRGIIVTILHPGMVATDMTERFGHSPAMQAPNESASLLLQRMDEATLETTGTFRHANGESLPW